MNTITADMAISTVERLLADPNYGPDHKARCLYGTKDAPVCIVGHILAEHDPDVFTRFVAETSQRGAGVRVIDGAGYGYDIFSLIRENAVEVADDALASALVLAQEAQDDGRPWSVAAAPILALKKETNL